MLQTTNSYYLASLLMHLFVKKGFFKLSTEFLMDY